MRRIKIALTSANPSHSLTRIGTAGICIYDLDKSDELTVTFEIDPSSLPLLQTIAKRNAEEIRIIYDGRFPIITGLKRRWIMLAGLVFIILLTILLPTRVLFVRVDGNIHIPERLIIEKAAQCGIEFGASRREVRSERVKNRLLQLLPQLQWAGINTSGCVATISVQERSATEVEEKYTGIGNMVSLRDGVVQSITIEQGSGLCKVGQAVKKGEILISGYTDCGLHIRAERAEGEVYALTNRELEAVMLLSGWKKTSKIAEEKKFSLVIGKKRINLYKDSGILDTTCDKMYLYSYVTLPGGFQLPVALIEERWITWETESCLLSEDTASEVLTDLSVDYLQDQMIAGQIISSSETIQSDSDVIRLTGSYACSEMIGQILYEETLRNNG